MLTAFEMGVHGILGDTGKYLSSFMLTILVARFNFVEHLLRRCRAIAIICEVKKKKYNNRKKNPQKKLTELRNKYSVNVLKVFLFSRI